MPKRHRVALLLLNVTAALELHYAVPAVGGILVPLNTRLAPNDYAYILEHSGAEVVFADQRLRARLVSLWPSRSGPS
jgi:fatty-acyl-CoA synthase